MQQTYSIKVVIGKRGEHPISIVQDPDDGTWSIVESLGVEEGGTVGYNCIGDYDSDKNMTDLRCLSDESEFFTFWSKELLGRVDGIAYDANSAIAEIWQVHDNHNEIFTFTAVKRAAEAVGSTSRSKIKRLLGLTDQEL